MTIDDFQRVAVFQGLGMRVAQLRHEQGLSQQALADQLGIAQQIFVHYEVGRARMPVSQLPEVARFFGVGVDDPAVSAQRHGQTRPRNEVSATNRALRPATKRKTESGDGNAGRVLSQASR